MRLYIFLLFYVLKLLCRIHLTKLLIQYVVILKKEIYFRACSLKKSVAFERKGKAKNKNKDKSGELGINSIVKW